MVTKTKSKQEPKYQLAPEPNDDDWIVLQEILHAISSVPTVWERIEAYLIARNIENPREAVERWHKIADC